MKFGKSNILNEINDSFSGVERVIPAGFAPYKVLSAFMELMGDIYARPEGEGLITLGLYISERHLNHQEAVHGGMVATLADNTMGYHARLALGSPIATVSLNVDYLGRLQLGDWLEVSCQVDRCGKRLVFLACSGAVNGQTAFRAHGVFSAIRRG